MGCFGLRAGEPRARWPQTCHVPIPCHLGTIYGEKIGTGNREHATSKTRISIEYSLLCSVSSSSSKPRAHLERIPTPGRSSYPAEEYELSPSLEEWSKSAHRHRLRPHYRDGDTIDWWHEDASERERWKGLVSQHGLRGLVSPLIDVTQLWFVMIFTGICVGLAGGWLDILAMW